MPNENIKYEFKNYWRDIDKKILFSFIILFLLGLFFSFSSTSSLAGERLNKDYYFFFYKHLFFMFLAMGIMFCFSFIKLQFLKKSIIPLFIFFLILLFLVPMIGVEVKGSKRWLDLFFFRLQPIELIKPFFILITALILTSENIKKSNSTYILSFLILISLILLLINQPDIGQTILIVTSWIAVIFVSGINILIAISIFLIFLILLSFILYIFPEKFGYIILRLKTFYDPKIGDSFQTDKALEAIKLGGLKGQGMGEGILKDNVPEAHTDYIIAVVSEEFGSLISISIIILFLYIAFRIIKICLRQKNDEIKISLCGLSAMLIFQTFIHIGVNTSLIPTTGMTLPFLSYGGSSLIGSSFLAGIILNYTKNRASQLTYE
tara:strand:- start:198 stop:1331 length:1134 start_codon:yes stop_codon:yes gene_type:complete